MLGRLSSLWGQDPDVAFRVMLELLFPLPDGRCDDNSKPLAASARKAKRDVDNAMPM